MINCLKKLHGDKYQNAGFQPQLIGPGKNYAEEEKKNPRERAQVSSPRPAAAAAAFLAPGVGCYDLAPAGHATLFQRAFCITAGNLVRETSILVQFSSNIQQIQGWLGRLTST